MSSYRVFQSPTNRVLNSVILGTYRACARESCVSIPYKSGPKFCGSWPRSPETTSVRFQSPTNRVLNSVSEVEIDGLKLTRKFQSPTNRVLNSVRRCDGRQTGRRPPVSIPYKSGPKFCDARAHAHTRVYRIWFQSPTNRVLNSVAQGSAAVQKQFTTVSIPYKSGPKFCGASRWRASASSRFVSIPYKSGPKFCECSISTSSISKRVSFNPLQIGS